MDHRAWIKVKGVRADHVILRCWCKRDPMTGHIRPQRRAFRGLVKEHQAMDPKPYHGVKAEIEYPYISWEPGGIIDL